MSSKIKERKLNRLKDYNYNSDGYYYITICTKNRECLFGEIVEGDMIYSDYGNIAVSYWKNIPDHFANTELDEFVVMPNHIHGIIITVGNAVGNADLRSLRAREQGQDEDRSKMMIPKIIHGFKSSVTRKIRRVYNDYSFAWQKSYYDRIIRNENELDNVRQYIINNVAKWSMDDYFGGNNE